MSPKSRGRVAFLSGPTGAGKTTTGMLWATTREGPTWFYDWDAVRSAVVIGDAVRGFDEMDLDAQYRLAADVIAESARRTIEAGIDCVVAGACPHPSAVPPRYSKTWVQMSALKPLIVVLLPDVESCVQRQAADGARRGSEADAREAVEFWHPLFAAWTSDPNAVILDTSDLNRAQVVAKLEQLWTAGRD